MRKLHVKTESGFKPVFCHMNGRIITTNDPIKALPSKACWAQDDLEWFRTHFANDEFELINIPMLSDYPEYTGANDLDKL